MSTSASVQKTTSAFRRRSRKSLIRVIGDLAFVELSMGLEAVIDASDVDLVRDYVWWSDVKKNTAYAVTYITRKGRPRQRLSMHRLLCGAPPWLQVDHINRSGIDNRRSNLRPATRSENICNAKVPITNKSGHKGVSWCKRSNKWRAVITKDGKVYHLGYSPRPEDAALLYSAASSELHGNFGRVS
jgi:hypothetical protein